MAVQLIHAPASASGDIPAGAGIGRYLWMRFHRMFGGVLLFCLVTTLIDRLFFAGPIGTQGRERDFSHLLLMMLPPGALLLSPLVAIFDIDETLWTLPLRTKTLIGWLLFYGCAGSALCWLIDVVCIWRPAGVDVPIAWPAAAAAAALATLFSVRCQPFAPGAVQGFVYLLSASVLIGAGACAVGAAPAALTAGYLGVIPVAALLAVAGAKRTRSGNMVAVPTLRREFSSRPLLGRFRSPSSAQVWRESHSSRFLAATLCAICGVFTLPALATSTATEISVLTFLTHGAHIVNASLWAELAPVMIGLILAGNTLTGGMSLGLGADSGKKGAEDTTRTPIFAAYPIDYATQVRAKLRVAADSALASMIAVLPFLIIWLAQTGWEGERREYLGAALWSALGAHAPEKAVAAFLLLPVLLWKMQADTLCITLTGRRWISGTFYVGLLGLLAIPQFSHALLAAAKYLLAHPMSPPVIAALATAALLKLALTVFLTVILRRRRMVTTQTLRQVLIGWTTAAALFFTMICAAFAPVQISWQSAALTVILLMPGVRLALAPLALAWGRSR
ncbi:hypothetical protein CCAX7_57960 [Capsulimonas corticalis]|uniref:Uncharacterized protein n=1 Tax=Capsulimonas corticalis TaxID=2219043 RepID=A0A402D081_9BACT|nr:hypothetical protein [Capsulimonas corticalis]BDI33745.1 hypothetical protein CCAX7_57960 [Capsulimonas corticalis]